MKVTIQQTCKNGLIILFLLGMNSFVFAQSTLTSAEAQNKTYELYTQGNWKELTKVGMQALDNGYDYYFMRMRVGVGYYQQKKYRLAQKHFKKAIAFNQKSDIAKEYLYYCLVFTGRAEEARKLTKTFSMDLKKKTQTGELPAVEHVFAEFATKVIEEAYKEGNNTTYFGNATNVQVGAKHFVKNNFSLTHAFTAFNQESVYGEAKQTQYYVGANVPLKDNWSLQPAVHIVSTDFTGYAGFEDTTDQQTNIAASIQVTKNFNYLDVFVGGTISKVMNLDRKVAFGGFSYAPLGNNNWLLGGTFYGFKGQNETGMQTSMESFTYFELGKRFSAKVSYLLNNNTNVIENNVYFVNNSIGTTTNRLGVQLNAFTNKKFSLYGIYQLENKEIVDESIPTIDFSYNLFLIGTKYYF